MNDRDFVGQHPGILVPIIVTELDRITRLPSPVTISAFLPDALPTTIPLNPSIHLDLEAAAQALGTLSGLGALLANPYLLIRPFLRREAVASSRIEGTVVDLQDLVLYEEDEKSAAPAGDVREVANYVRALEYGLRRPEDRGISSTLIRELHAQLMRDVRGGDRNPGKYRQGQVIIGQPGMRARDARFVPPPAHEVPMLINDLQRAIEAESDLPKLIRVALIHYQFETIHPF
ncbi:MAG: Fic family protein, partial [Thermomicrobiales bacterium]